ncbi:hypothetical protein COLU111180_11910 [Cohnella lubricantis]|nr:hypothetical protein [Cohnella lubricantis]
MKTSVDRIRFYTRKANEYSALRFDQLRRRTSRRGSCYRFPRLIQYKSLLNERLRLERLDNF